MRIIRHWVSSDSFPLFATMNFQKQIMEQNEAHKYVSLTFCTTAASCRDRAFSFLSLRLWHLYFLLVFLFDIFSNILKPSYQIAQYQVGQLYHYFQFDLSQPLRHLWCPLSLNQYIVFLILGFRYLNYPIFSFPNLYQQIWNHPNSFLCF